MAYRVIVTPSAILDLEEYADYISQDSPKQAKEWLIKAWATIFSLGDNPRRFAVIAEADELGAEVRDVLHYSHRIVFLVKAADDVVEILRVYHSARKPLTEKDIR